MIQTVSRFALTALLCLAPLAAADYKTEPAGAPPDEVPAALKQVIAEDGVRVIGPDGVAGEFWMRTTDFEGEESSELGIRNDWIPLGSFLGVVRFPEGSHDFRDQSIAPGVYSMRFYLQPVDGAHYEQVRDFTLLAPLGSEVDPATNVDYAQAIKMSYAVGNAHPTVLHMAWSEGDEAPNVWENDHGHTILDLMVGGEPTGFTIKGIADH